MRRMAVSHFVWGEKGSCRLVSQRIEGGMAPSVLPRSLGMGSNSPPNHGRRLLLLLWSLFLPPHLCVFPPSPYHCFTFPFWVADLDKRYVFLWKNNLWHYENPDWFRVKMNYSRGRHRQCMTFPLSQFLSLNNEMEAIKLKESPYVSDFYKSACSFNASRQWFSTFFHFDFSSAAKSVALW